MDDVVGGSGEWVDRKFNGLVEANDMVVTVGFFKIATDAGVLRIPASNASKDISDVEGSGCAKAIIVIDFSAQNHTAFALCTDAKASTAKRVD